VDRRRRFAGRNPDRSLAAEKAGEVIMALAAFFVLLCIVVAAIGYPLLPGQAPARPAPVMTDVEIERAVQKLRRAGRERGLNCPSCGKGYQAGDRFCVRCGETLPVQEVKAAADACPSCGVALRGDEVFCSKCGHRLAAEEAE
jgi:predicted nucleic acid-binding Zn ribbon protein